MCATIVMMMLVFFFFFSSRRRHTRLQGDWSSDVCSSDLDIPTNIPPINLQEHFDPKDYTGTGVEGGIGTGIVPSSDQVFMESVVEERPEVLSGPQPQYPDLLRQAGVQGRVLVQAIIDTTGRAEPASLKIIQSPNPGFDQPAKNYVLRALFRPARVHGRAVRVLVNLPIDFKIKR